MEWDFPASPAWLLELWGCPRQEFGVFFWNPSSSIPQNPAGSASLAAPSLGNDPFFSPPCEIPIFFFLLFFKHPPAQLLKILRAEPCGTKKTPGKKPQKTPPEVPPSLPLPSDPFPWIFSRIFRRESSVPFPGQPLDGNSSLDYGWKNIPENRGEAAGLGTSRVQVLEGFYCLVWGLQFMLVKLWDFGGFLKCFFACGNNAEGSGDHLEVSPPKLSCPFCPQTQPV